MIYIESPKILDKKFSDKTKVFLGGGITDCPDWQKKAIDLLEQEDIVIFNPRRKDFDIERYDVEKEQIEWEFNCLRDSDIIIFWFPKETLCPITLFELGAHLERDVKVLVGTHRDYKRRSDVIIQSKLVRKNITVNETLEDLINELKKLLK